MKKEYPDHKMTHFLLGFLIFELTGHGAWIVFGLIQIVLIVMFYVRRHLDKKLSQLRGWEMEVRFGL